jgi:hypothetical protein
MAGYLVRKKHTIIRFAAILFQTSFVVITYGGLKGILETESGRYEELTRFPSNCVGYNHPLHLPHFKEMHIQK